MKHLVQIFISCLMPLSLTICIEGCASINNLTTNNSSGITSLNVSLYPQLTGEWCWAASAEMCMVSIGNVDIAQCTQANDQLGMADCCGKAIDNNCIQGGFPDFVRYGFTPTVTNFAPLKWSDIKIQISNLKKPFAFSWQYTGGGGHMMVITGYYTDNKGMNYVYVNDPLEVNVGSTYTLTYDEYVSGSDHTHWNDYYNITKN